jgi:SAM-dependent methyltransferase
MKPFDIVRETNLNLGTDFKSPKELWAYARIASDRLRDRWLQSGRTDYGIYKDPDYVYEGLICFERISHHSVTGLERFHRAHNVPKGTLLDIYNGIGLSSVYASMVGFEVAVVNDNPAQVNFMQQSAVRNLGYELPVVDSLTDIPDGSFDVAMTLEVLEHFTEPLLQLQETLNKIVPNGILVETTGFACSEYPGHFAEYTVDGEQVPHRQVSRHISGMLKTGCVKMVQGIQAKPRIWGKVMVGYDKKPRVWREGCPTSAHEFRGLTREMLALGLPPFTIPGVLSS